MSALKMIWNITVIAKTVQMLSKFFLENNHTCQVFDLSQQEGVCF